MTLLQHTEGDKLSKWATIMRFGFWDLTSVE